MRPDKQIADFDSATGMLRVLAKYLRGRDAPLLGRYPGAAEPVFSGLLGAANRLPRLLQEKAYAASGWAEAIPPDRVGEVQADRLAEWVTGRYPRRRYPVVFVGSSNGAMIHLAAALGAPWLPQTLLIPVRRRGGHPDEPAEALRLHRNAGNALLDANPDLELHHMHDANQDRLMVAGMSYFRVKWRRLPGAYEQFLRDCLPPGGTVVTLECGLRWPTTRITNRYFFQHGALGGATPDEFRDGSPRIAQYLARYGSPHRRWDAPEPDGDSPEAEWGFQRSLLDSIRDVTAQHNLRLRRLRFEAPEDLSPVVADLYRNWYERRGIPPNRLLAENFLLLEPWWTLRTGSVPYWAVFNTEPSRRSVLAYLDESNPYDEIRLILFSHGVESVGLASIDDWRQVLGRARKVGDFSGVDIRAYPRDFAVFARAHRELAKIRHLHPMPPTPLDLAQAEDFLEQHAHIDWTAEER
jgi:hypothetical protein